MEKQKIVLIIGLVAIFGVLIYLISFLSQSKTAENKNNLPTLSPTSFQLSNTTPQTNQPTPTLIPITQTGGSQEDLPKEIIDLSTEKQNLHALLPVNEPSFGITFDYENDLFVVTLYEPKAESKTQFETWLSSNYPHLPLDRFKF